MPWTLLYNQSRAILWRAFGISICVTFIITFAFSFFYIPAGVQYYRLALSAVLGIAPIALGLTIPVAVGLAVLWCSARSLQDNFGIVAQAHGLSPWQIAQPALLSCSSAAILNLVIMSTLAPAGTSLIQDALFTIHLETNFDLLHEKTFNIADAGQAMFFFSRQDQDLQDILLWHKLASGKTELIRAEGGQRVRELSATALLLRHGSISDFDSDNSAFTTTQFNLLLIDLGGQERDGKRLWRGYDEMDVDDFLRQSPMSVQETAQWYAELAKRFLLPLTCLLHGLFAFAWLHPTQPRRDWLRPLGLCALAVFSWHTLTILLIELFVSRQAVFLALLPFSFAGELIASLVMLSTPLGSTRTIQAMPDRYDRIQNTVSSSRPRKIFARSRQVDCSASRR